MTAIEKDGTTAKRIEIKILSDSKSVSSMLKKLEAAGAVKEKDGKWFASHACKGCTNTVFDLVYCSEKCREIHSCLVSSV